MDESGVELSDQDRASWSAVEHLVRLFRLRSADEPALVSAVCDEAVRLIDPARHAGVILAVGRRHLEVVAATSPVPQQLDELQQREGAGPCLAAARSQEVIRIEDVRDGPPLAAVRRRRPPPRASGRCCACRCTSTRPRSARSASTPTRRAPSRTSTESVARVLAVLAAITLSESRGKANLERALESRDLIGQAKGIIMQARRMTADEAFALLVRRSQETNTKLVEVAEAVVTTGIV